MLKVIGNSIERSKIEIMQEIAKKIEEKCDDILGESI